MKMRWLNYIRSTRISVRLALMYTMILLVSWVIIVCVFYRISYENTYDSAEAISVQTLHTVSESIDTLIQNAAYYSRIILSGSEVTKALESGDGEKESAALQQFISLVDTETHINGIYMWDLQNNSCSIDRKQHRSLRVEDIREIAWYEEVRNLAGSYCLKLNADRILTNSSAENVLSLMRSINSPVDYQPLGILMINLDIGAFYDSFNSVDENSVSSIYVLDDTDKIVASRADIPLPKLWEARNKQDGRTSYVYDGKKYLVSERDMKESGWRVLTAVPINSVFGNSHFGSMIFALAMGFLALFCIVGYFIMKYYVAKPLESMAGAMNRMSGKRFAKIRDEVPFSEMEILKSTYNQMVDEIHELIERVYAEEKIKRKAELNALQAQMKPHFLYNTIDAMSYLALSGKNEEVYDALEAFGSYYRILLSKGREMISVKEEIAMVRDYLELQKLRYGDSLRYVLKVEPEIERMYVLKMILQPLVENSVNHGIRPKQTSGVVYVEGRKEDSYIRFCVEDDGVGMDEAQMAKLDRETLDENEKSFGLRGTIERIKIFYDGNFEYEIHSGRNRGTTLIVKVPVRYEEEEGHD